MEENLSENNVHSHKRQERLLFGDFNNEDYDKYFSVDRIAHPNPVEFSFERQNNVSDWINKGTWYGSNPQENQITQNLDLPISPIVSTKSFTIDEVASPIDNRVIASQATFTFDQNENVEQDSTKINGEIQSKVSSEEHVKAVPKETRPVLSWAAHCFKKSEAKPSVKDMKHSSNISLVNGKPTVANSDNKMSEERKPDPVCGFLSLHPSSIIKDITFQLRGLINSSNWCFINATLQSLLASPYFYQLYATLPKCVPEKAGPLTTSMVEFIAYFQQLKISDTSKRLPSVALSTGAPFEPKTVYDALPSSKSSLSEKGRQQDAEEFLSFLLNGLHDELVSFKTNEEDKQESKTIEIENINKGPGVTKPLTENNQHDKEWQQVGPKNKSVLTRETRHEQTFITSIFGGSLRSSVRQSGAKESVTLQPFFTLPLDIQADDTKDVSAALRHFFAKECLQGYTCQKTNSQVEASRKTSLESLPTVLILQLKYFLYDQSGGCQKIHKPITLTLDLNLTKEMMSSTAKTISPAYTLFSVVYHHGKSAADGHYTSAVRDRSTKEPYTWVHCDDSVIEPYSINDVIRHEHGRTPYLLFYEKQI